MTVDLSAILPQLPKLRDERILARLTPAQKEQMAALLEDLVTDAKGWPRAYVNRDTGKVYTPHNEQVARFVGEDGPWRRGALLGGEGSGKSAASIIKDLERARRGMPGLMASPSLPHFQRSLWKEFQRWCPWDCVVPSHRRMGNLTWMPSRPFDVVFENGAYIHCVGVVNVGSLEGPNLNWAHFDEARHYPDKSAITVLEGRIRIPGPNGEPPQMWFSTTPRMHWLLEYFGPLKCTCPRCGRITNDEGVEGIAVQEGQPLICPTCGETNLTITDELVEFKMGSYVVRMSTRENVENLQDDFYEKRGESLTSAEQDVLLEGKWRTIEEGQPFLPTMTWWDSCREELPPLTPHEPLVIALDAATGRKLKASDCFTILGVTRHPDPERADTDIAVRFQQTWQAPPGGEIDYQGTPEDPGPERVLLNLCGYDLDARGGIIYLPDKGYAVVCITYDPLELHSTAQRLSRAGIGWFREFSQSGLRFEADRQLLNLIQQRRVAHDGNADLRRHILNADRKLDATGKKLRIVKRVESLPIDLAVALSMGAWMTLDLNI